MSCPEFDKYGLLLISGELSEDEGREYRRHCKECQACVAEIKEYRKLFAQTSQLEEHLPAPEVRNFILQQSRRKSSRVMLGSRIRNLWQEMLQNQLWLWGTSTAVTAAVVLLLLLKPFSHYDQLRNDDLLAWNDNFLVETLSLEEDMDNIYTLSTLSVIVEEIETSSDNLSTMTDDFSLIRDGIEDLLQDINVF